ncbi:MAG: TraR/DksA family transcriptional regulator [Thermodesulfobacteriota bacterium]
MSDMAEEKKKRLRSHLLERKREMWGELRDELFKKLGSEYNAQFGSPTDIEETGLIDTIEDLGIAVADLKRRELEAMDRALTKLDEGTYGVCDACGAEIDEERLRVAPTAALCVKCASEREEKKPTL